MMPIAPVTVRPAGRGVPPDVVRASRRSGRMRSRVKPPTKTQAAVPDETLAHAAVRALVLFLGTSAAESRG